MNFSLDWHRTHRKIEWDDLIGTGIRGEYLRVIIAPALVGHMKNMFFLFSLRKPYANNLTVSIAI